jgi:signal-transduction protein with cAMP-binding, CBS, and nucleotidyltransferase domain
MVDWPGGTAMFVEGLLPKARERLVTIANDVPLIEAAKLLQTGTDLVIVCDSAGLLAGVITKTDIVAQISQCQGASCIMATALVMTRDVVLCESKDLLRDVWTRIKERGLKNVPVVDQDSRPLGLLHARDILQVLLSESENEEAILRDYVMGVGYR